MMIIICHLLIILSCVSILNCFRPAFQCNNTTPVVGGSNLVVLEYIYVRNPNIAHLTP